MAGWSVHNQRLHVFGCHLLWEGTVGCGCCHALLVWLPGSSDRSLWDTSCWMIWTFLDLCSPPYVRTWYSFILNYEFINTYSLFKCLPFYVWKWGRNRWRQINYSVGTPGGEGAKCVFEARKFYIYNIGSMFKSPVPSKITGKGVLVINSSMSFQQCFSFTCA